MFEFLVTRRVVELMEPYSKKELAKKLGVKPRTIVNWTQVKENPLPFHKRDVYKNRSVWEYVFYAIEVERWLVSRSVSFSSKHPNQEEE